MKKSRIQNISSIVTQKIPFIILKTLSIPGLVYFLCIISIFFILKPEIQHAETSSPQSTVSSIKKGTNDTSPLPLNPTKSDINNPTPTISSSPTISTLSPEQIQSITDKIKGDMLGQLTLPIVIAIASIFAAFAVKDIVAVLLNNSSMKELEEKLRRDIEVKVIPKAIKSNSLVRRVNSLEVYINWLEYEKSNEALQNLISLAHSSNKSNFQEGVSLVQENFLDLYQSSKNSLVSIAEEYNLEYLNEIFKSKAIMLEADLKDIQLESSVKQKIDDELQSVFDISTHVKSNNSDAKVDIHNLMESAFLRQAILLIATLNELDQNDLNRNMCLEIFNYLTNRKSSREARGNLVQQFYRNHPISPRLSRSTKRKR